MENSRGPTRDEYKRYGFEPYDHEETPAASVNERIRHVASKGRKKITFVIWFNLISWALVALFWSVSK